MGLDMTLYATGAVTDHPSAQPLLRALDIEPGSVVERPIAYWCKAHDVHRWCSAGVFEASAENVRRRGLVKETQNPV